jgi:nicotinamide mononucleotide adenylyltransferase
MPSFSSRNCTNLSCIADLSPVADASMRNGLAHAEHRVNMCQLAVSTQEQQPPFIMVDTWETLQSVRQPVAKVLDHFDYEINEKLGGIDDGTGKKVKAKVALLGGAHVVESFSQPDIWSKIDLNHILRDCTSSLSSSSSRNIDIDRWRIHYRAS